VLEQITRDHSWLQEQIDAGLITPQQAALSSSRNLVTRALGVEEDVLVEINEFLVEPQDLYLMCSDGLSEMVGHKELTDLLLPACLWLTRRASSSTPPPPAGDNISVVLVQAAADSPKRGFMSRLLGAA
jgi:protein phosphatase